MKSNSQWGQDVWVAEFLEGKRGGFFLEMGAGDGIWISNTLLLEKEFGWTGILVEPTSAFERLIKNRPACICDHSCIAGERKSVTLFEIFDRGQAEINEKASQNTLLSVVRENVDAQEGEKLSSYWGHFKHAYCVETITLTDLLHKYNAPHIIDYFSLDVEDYEYEILKNFNFGEYRFLCLSIERPTIELQHLLENNGYRCRTQLGQDLMYVSVSEK
jgi:hypothetical protein